jgi:hypothetical protein
MLCKPRNPEWAAQGRKMACIDNLLCGFYKKNKAASANLASLLIAILWQNGS